MSNGCTIADTSWAVTNNIGEVKRIAASTVTDHMAVLAPGIGNVEIVADQGETAGNMQGLRIGRRVEKQRMLPARSAVILENANVVDARFALASIADPPHCRPPLMVVARCV